MLLAGLDSGSPADTEYYHQLTLRRQAASAAAATDSAAAAAKPAGQKFMNNGSDQNRAALVRAYTPVYEDVVYELELAADRGEDVKTAAQQIRQRHSDDPVFGNVVDMAAEQVGKQTVGARHTNEVEHSVRASIDQAMQSRDAALKDLQATTSTQWHGSADGFDRHVTAQQAIIDEQTKLIDYYVNQIDTALGAEIDAEVKSIRTKSGRTNTTVDDYFTASSNISKLHQDPLVDALLPDAVTSRPGFTDAVGDLDRMIEAEANRLAKGMGPGFNRADYDPSAIPTRDDYVAAGNAVRQRMPASAALIDQRVDFLAAKKELAQIRATADAPGLPPGYDKLLIDSCQHRDQLKEILQLAKDDPVAYWALEQAGLQGIVFNPYTVDPAKYFETRDETVDGKTVRMFRVGSDAQGNAIWESEDSLKQLAHTSPDKFALLALSMQDKTASGMSGRDAAQAIMATQTLLRFDDTKTRATDKFRQGEAAWARGDQDAAKNLWNESLKIIATNQSHANTAEEAKILGGISTGLFTPAWMSKMTDEVTRAVDEKAKQSGYGNTGAGKADEWGAFINALTRNGACPAEFANVALDTYLARFNPDWLSGNTGAGAAYNNASSGTSGDPLFKALSRLTQVTGRANEFAALLASPVYEPIVRNLYLSHFGGVKAAIADPEGIDPRGDAALAEAFLAETYKRSGAVIRVAPGGSDAIAFRERLSEVIAGAKKDAPGVWGQAAAADQTRLQLDKFSSNSSSALHGFFNTYTDPARLPHGFSVDA
ncbi:MAG TPA: hypothetical protein VKB34_15325, partial [Povalibacter sp.]|nr:hypothetical protein [Povalibacter sp.]